MSELIFEVIQEADGGFVAECFTESIVTEADTLEQLRSNVREVVQACAQSGPGRPETWINHPIEDLYVRLHELGAAHSLECWLGGELVGGLYGVALSGAFFGESMFSRARDASKVALAHLVARLNAGGFELLDTQYVTEHLRGFGAVEIPRRRYRAMLDRAIAGEPADFMRLPASISGADALAIIAERA